jgi:hypothetical protein
MADAPNFDNLRLAAQSCARGGDVEGAVIALHRALACRRGDLETQQQLLRLLAENPAAFAKTSPLPPPARGGLVSVITCSVDRAKLERARASYARAFAAEPWELVAIADARSLAEGYARGLARAAGEAVIFAHDDIEILSSGMAGALWRALEEADVVGLAGATALRGPAFAWGGKEYTRGRIAEPVRGMPGVALVVFNPAPGITTGLQAIDGVFMAVRREAAGAIGFDAGTFDGFHLYDVDFSYRAHRAGRRVAVTSEIVLRHDSEGRFDARWEEYARRFAAKFPEVEGARVQNLMSRIPFPDARRLLDFCARLDEAGRRAMNGGPGTG